MASAATITVIPRQNVSQRGVKITWEDPPEIGKSLTGPYYAFASALRERPNTWAVLKEVPREHARRAWAQASNISAGKGRDWQGGFEASARTVGDVVKVYVRYVGPVVSA